MKRRNISLLAVSFCVLVLALLFLIARLPPIYSYGFEYSEPANEVVVFYRTGGGYCDPVRIRLEDGGLSYNRRELPRKVGLASGLRNNGKKIVSEAGIRDSGNILKWADLETPAYPLLVDERFAVWVTQEEGKFNCKDLQKPDAEISSIIVDKHVEPFGCALLTSDRILLTSKVVFEAQQCVSFNRIVKLEDGQLREIAKWPNANRCFQVADELWEFDLQDLVIRKRSVLDGKVKETIPFPKEMGISSSGQRVQLQMLDDVLLFFEINSNESRFFAMPSMKRLTVGPGFSPSLSGTVENSSIFYKMQSGRVGHFLSWDMEQNAKIWEYKLRSSPTLFRSLGDELLIGSRGNGYIIDFVSRKTGTVTRSLQPFAWAVWLIPVLVFGWFVWVLQFQRNRVVSPIAGVWFAFAVTLAAVTGYMTFWKLIPGVPQVPLFNYCHGLFLGAAIAGFTWLILGKERLSLRYLPLLGVFILQLFICGFVFSKNYRFAAEAFISTIVPSALTAIPILFVRWAGFRFWLNDKAESEERQAESAVRFPIRDLFIASFCFAIFLAVLRPAMTWLNLPAIDPLVIYGSVATVVGTFLVLASTQSKYLPARCLAFALILALLAMMLVEAMYEFTMGVSLPVDRMSMVPVVFRVIGTGLITQYIIQFAYVSTGWRLTRQAQTS